jgi:hypothetical protein
MRITNLRKFPELYGTLARMPSLRQLTVEFNSFSMALYDHLKLLTQLKTLAGYGNGKKKALKESGWDVDALPFKFDHVPLIGYSSALQTYFRKRTKIALKRAHWPQKSASNIFWLSYHIFF